MERRGQKNFANHLCGFRFLLVPAKRASTKDDRRSSHTNDSRHEGDDGNESTPHTHHPLYKDQNDFNDHVLRTVYGRTSPQRVRRNESTIISVVLVSTIVFSGRLRQDAAQPPKANGPALGVHALPLGANDAASVPSTNNSQTLSHGCEQAPCQPIKRSSLCTKALRCKSEDPWIYLCVTTETSKKKTVASSTPLQDHFHDTLPKRCSIQPRHLSRR